MLALMKRDTLVNRGAIIGVEIIMIFGVVLQQEIILLAGVLALSINLFYYDSKVKADRFMVSLPIERINLVRSRYLSIVSNGILLIMTQWIVTVIINRLSSEAWIYEYTGQDVLIIFSFILLVSACVSVYYLFRAFNVANYVLIGILFFGYLSILGAIFTRQLDENGESIIYFNSETVYLPDWVEATFTFQPYITFPFIAICVFLLSMKLSEWSIKRKLV
ncbi:ABC-2 transporter permease [Radiobacillus sp. PE A8.2]|uniref:ABC-2 transporter permease n=1 Tax=Radiobacillus sp. PE A8.2 TaxID=3380349 RepID=UPI00388D6E36